MAVGFLRATFALTNQPLCQANSRHGNPRDKPARPMSRRPYGCQNGVGGRGVRRVFPPYSIRPDLTIQLVFTVLVDSLWRLKLSRRRLGAIYASYARALMTTSR